MKIAVESNDGETLKSPFDEIRGYLVFDVVDHIVEDANYFEVKKPTSILQIPSLNSCKTIITRGMDRDKRQKFNRDGFDIFVTFNTSARGALDSFLKEKIINQPQFV